MKLPSLLIVLLVVGPWVALSATEEFVLTEAGVVHFTNVARRSAANLEPLAEASDLNAVAQARLKDMFARQYFSHSSPVTEEGAAEIAERIGYQYLSIAENLARGYFADDQELVRFWMESLAHRQTILSPGYTEIGVAVGKGTLDGRPVWVGVQVFARPLSACPQPDARLRAQADTLKAEAAAVASQAAALLTQLGTPDPRQRGEIELFNGRVTRYNALIASHNALAEQVRALAALYNGQSERLAACVELPITRPAQTGSN